MPATEIEADPLPFVYQECVRNEFDVCLEHTATGN
jgi:hypothetical protein